MARTWTDEQVAAHKSHTELQLRSIIADRDGTINKLERKIKALESRSGKDDDGSEVR